MKKYQDLCFSLLLAPSGLLSGTGLKQGILMMTDLHRTLDTRGQFGHRGRGESAKKSTVKLGEVTLVCNPCLSCGLAKHILHSSGLLQMLKCSSTRPRLKANSQVHVPCMVESTVTPPHVAPGRPEVQRDDTHPGKGLLWHLALS